MLTPIKQSILSTKKKKEALCKKQIEEYYNKRQPYCLIFRDYQQLNWATFHKFVAASKVIDSCHIQHKLKYLIADSMRIKLFDLKEYLSKTSKKNLVFKYLNQVILHDLEPRSDKPYGNNENVEIGLIFDVNFDVMLETSFVGNDIKKLEIEICKQLNHHLSLNDDKNKSKLQHLHITNCKKTKKQ